MQNGDLFIFNLNIFSLFDTFLSYLGFHRSSVTHCRIRFINFSHLAV